MRAAESHQRRRSVAKAEQGAANFHVQIGLRRSSYTRLTQIKNGGKKEGEQGQARSNQQARTQVACGKRIAASPEKSGDTGPTPHKIPQMPKKIGPTGRKAS